jgi:NifB/MoaA-like Fe-S oxidoreductase
VLVVTGKLAENYLKELFAEVGLKQITVKAIENRFFGEKITVSGLVTARDLLDQLGDISDFEAVIIPDVMLKADEPLFLDGLSVKEVEKEIGKQILTVPVKGQALITLLEELE